MLVAHIRAVDIMWPDDNRPLYCPMYGCEADLEPGQTVCNPCFERIKPDKRFATYREYEKNALELQAARKVIEALDRSGSFPGALSTALSGYKQVCASLNR